MRNTYIQLQKAYSIFSPFFVFSPEDSSKSQNDREKMTSSSLSVESLKGSGSLALSVRPSPMKCMGSNSLMLASLTKTMNSREQVVQLLSASPQTAFQKASLTSSGGGGNNNRNESSSNYGRSSGSSSTSTSSTFYAVSSNKCSIQSPESNPLLTPTELLPFKTAWCTIIPTVPLHITTPQKNVVNIDVVYSHLPEYAAHYSIDMYDYYNIVEDEYRPDHQYLFTQTFINAEQRAYLVNAMVWVICSPLLFIASFTKSCVFWNHTDQHQQGAVLRSVYCVSGSQCRGSLPVPHEGKSPAGGALAYWSHLFNGEPWYLYHIATVCM